MIIAQPKDMKVSTSNGCLGISWSKDFGKITSEKFSKAQKYIDSECIRLMKPYTPYRNGILEKSVTLGTVIGSGRLQYLSPYARYLYYGEVYGPNFPIVEENGKTRIVFGKYDGPGKIIGWRSPKQKHPTGREIKYDTSKHPQAGKLWFERMKADHKDEILRGVAKILGGTSK